jgi:hypothetical protein
MTLKRLRQPKGRMVQLRMLPEAEMPRALVAPLEEDLVNRTRAVLGKLGYLTWSGRIRIFDRPLDGSRGIPFIPSLEPGCPDILGVMPDCTGRLFGVEAKRDLSEKERASQIAWHEKARYWGVLVVTARTVQEVVDFLELHRVRRG